LRSVGSASAAGSVNASLHQNLLYGNREGHFSYGQTILTPVSMASSRDSGSAADSGDEEHDGVILANAVDMEIECGHDVQDSPAQRRGRRVPSGTAELLPKSYVTPLYNRQAARYTPIFMINIQVSHHLQRIYMGLCSAMSWD
jgi:hypothetical protein